MRLQVKLLLAKLSGNDDGAAVGGYPQLSLAVFGHVVEDVSVDALAVLVGKGGEFAGLVVGDFFGSVFVEGKDK